MIGRAALSAAAALATALHAVAPASSAVLRTQTQVFENDGSDIGQGLFERFDPALGFLQEARLDWSSTYTATFDCPQPGGCATVFGRGLRFFLPDQVSTGGVETNSQSLQFGPVIQPQGPVTLQIELEPRNVFRATDFGVDLADLVGQGPVVDIVGTFLISVDGVNSISQDVTQTFENRFTLTYEFKAIPLPAAAPLLGGALALLVLLRRRQR